MGDLAGTLVPGSSAARARAEAEPDLFLNRYSLFTEKRCAQLGLFGSGKTSEIASTRDLFGATTS
jgi:hypothetical protein